nr:hypothetical protein [Lachnospiraceae bacterium]
MEEKEKSKRLKILLIAIITIAIIAVLVWLVFIVPISRYFENNTWATIRITGESHTDTDEAFYEDRECLKGDRISMGNISLEITQITHDGEVYFNVVSGTITDDRGNEINQDSLIKGVKKDYTSKDIVFSLEVIGNRYR